MKTTTQSVLSVINTIKKCKAIDAKTSDRFSGMFLLLNIPNRMWVKGTGMTGNKALATRFTYEAAKKRKEELKLDLAIVDEHTGEIINDSCDDIDTSKLTLEEAKKLYEEGKISKGQLDDVAIRLYEQKHQHDDLDASDIDDLIAEEDEAIRDYEIAIAECTDEVEKAKLTHILNEEKEHRAELIQLKEKGVKTLVDTRKSTRK